jgi:hypothetical protein
VGPYSGAPSVRQKPINGSAFRWGAGQSLAGDSIQVFDIHYHPKATRRYAWSNGLDNSKKRRFFAVFHQGPVDSPQAAVRAAIVREFRRKQRE